jgi:hypothetical protein
MVVSADEHQLRLSPEQPDQNSQLDNRKCAEIPAKRIGPEHPLRSSRLDVRSWLILIRTASTDVLSVLLDCRQGGVKGCEGSMPDAGHWLRNTVGRVS